MAERWLRCGKISVYVKKQGKMEQRRGSGLKGAGFQMRFVDVLNRGVRVDLKKRMQSELRLARARRVSQWVMWGKCESFPTRENSHLPTQQTQETRKIYW